MKKQLPKAVIFDWDNTVVDTWQLIYYSINKMLEEMGHQKWSEDEIRARTHLSMKDYFPKLFGDRWQEAGKIYVDAYHEANLEKLEFLPKALELIDFLHQKEVKLFVISNKRGPTLRTEAENFGVADKFVKIIGSNDAAEDKPSQKVVDFTLQGTGLEAAKDKTWFIGDSEVDLECAINSKCKPVLFGSGENIGTKFRNNQLLHFADHQEILGYFR